MINIIIIVKVNFSNYRFFNIFNNIIKDFCRNTIFIKAYMLINFINLINHINKLRKVDKQILSYSLFNLLYKSSQKKIR